MRVERLAKSLGVSKGSFYWHFDDRAALLAAVVNAWEQRSTLTVIEDVERDAAEPGAKLWALFEQVFGTPTSLDAFEAAVRSWAGHDEAVKKVVRRVDKRRLRFVAELLVEAGLPKQESMRRSELLYCTLIGEFVRRTYGGSKLDRAALRSLHDMLLRDT